jgi:LuxR family maltose regulon positive regulatory protein
MTASLRAICDRVPTEERRYLGFLLVVRLAVLTAARNGCVDDSDEFRRAMRLTASGATRQMILDAGPEVGALLAGFQEFARRSGRSKQLMVYASELLIGRWNEMMPQPGEIAGALSPREIEIVELIGQGRSNKEIARWLGIRPETVKTHVKNIFSKLGVERRAQAVAHAQARGLICEGRQSLSRNTGFRRPSGRSDRLGDSVRPVLPRDQAGRCHQGRLHAGKKRTSGI